MNNVIFLLPFFVLTTVVPLGADLDPASADRARLQGAWELADKPAEGSPRRTLEVKGDTFIFRADGQVTRLVTATLHATTEPKAMDLKEGGEDRPFLAIYKIDKERLTLCIAVENARPTHIRPTAFAAKSGQVLATYTRAR